MYMYVDRIHYTCCMYVYIVHVQCIHACGAAACTFVVLVVDNHLLTRKVHAHEYIHVHVHIHTYNTHVLSLLN